MDAQAIELPAAHPPQDDGQVLQLAVDHDVLHVSRTDARCLETDQPSLQTAPRHHRLDGRLVDDHLADWHAGSSPVQAAAPPSCKDWMMVSNGSVRGMRERAAATYNVEIQGSTALL